jgi:hypothetical protein
MKQGSIHSLNERQAAFIANLEPNNFNSAAAYSLAYEMDKPTARICAAMLLRRNKLVRQLLIEHLEAIDQALKGEGQIKARNLHARLLERELRSQNKK